MLKLERPCEPDCLHVGAPGWTEAYVIGRERNAAHPFSWRSAPCYREIRHRLAAMTQGHCAFCDGQIGVESRKTVEHFRPKSQFPELAYAWDNLFPCCDLCQSAKREQFDPALLKPDDPHYAFTDHFIVNYQTGEIEPSPHADEPARLRAEISIRLYALNLPERTIARRREWQHYCRDPDACLNDYNYRFFLE